MAPPSSRSIAHLIPPTAKPSSGTTSSNNDASSRLLTPTTNPIPLLSAPVAKTYSLVHTALVGLYYYLRSGALVADPLATLLWDLTPVAVLQAVFCAVCLPSAGGWNHGTDGGRILEGSATSGKAKSTRGGTAAIAGGGGNVSGTGSLRKRGGGGVKGLGVEKDGVGGSWGSRIMPTIFSLILTSSLPPLPLAALALCLGAPLYPTSLIPHTLVLSLHVSILAFLPIFYTHGVSALAWRDVSAAWLPFDEAGVWAGSIGCLVGGWVGAVPIALDWDREWQKWPCTVVWGVVLGWAVGRLITGGLRWGIGRRIDMSETVERPTEVMGDEGGKKQN